MNKLTAVLMVRDESHNIQEWLLFHRLVGFDNFLIWVDHCTDDTVEKIKEVEPDCELVDGQFERQIHYYTWAMEHLKGKSHWAACIDADEFLFPVQNDNLLDALSEYDDYAGVAVCQIIYGTSGHATRQPGLVIENYGKCSPLYFEMNSGDESNQVDSRMYKVIVKPDKVFRYKTSHFPITSAPFVQEDKKIPTFKRAGLTERRSVNVLRINHYFTKSREEWVAKVKKGRPSKSKPYCQELLDYYDSLTDEDWVLRDRFANKLYEKVVR